MRELRAALRLTQEQLSEIAGVRPQQVSDWETQRSNPSKTRLDHLARQLRISVYVFSEGGPRPASAVESAVPSAAPAIEKTLQVREALASYGDRTAGRRADDLRREDQAFVVSVRAILETMRRQIDALQILLPTPNAAGGRKEVAATTPMVETMRKQIDALEVLLLGTATRKEPAASAPMSALVAEMARLALQYEPALTAARRELERQQVEGDTPPEEEAGPETRAG